MACASAGLGAAPAQASVSVGGVWAGATVSYECSTRTVEGTAHTNSSLGGSGVLALAYVYDYATGSWSNAGAWVPADGIHQFVLRATNPYRYAYIRYARYVNGWKYADEYVPMSEPDIDGGAFCR
jgi:hypothetical protein